MIANLICRKFYDPTYSMVTKYVRLVPNVGVVGDSLSRSQSTFEEYDFVEYASQFKSSDFDVISLLNVGAYDMLKPTFVSSMSNMDFADSFQKLTFKTDVQ